MTYGEFPSPYFPVNFSYLYIFLIIGIVYSIKRRNKERKSIKDKTLSSIVLNDYSFTAYASLSILSLIYSIFQGILLGSTSCFIFNGVGSLLRYSSYVSTSFLYALASILILIIIRVIIEALTLIFRVAEDFSKFVNKQNV